MGETDSVASAGGGTRRRWLIAAAAALVVLAVAAAGWQIVARSAVGSVRIAYDARPIVCEGGEATVSPDPSGLSGPDAFAFDEETYQWSVGVVPGMTCGLRFHVVNDGTIDAAVSEVVLPGLGEEMATLMRPASVNPNGQVRLADTDGDAVFEISGGIGVAGGTSETFIVILEDEPADADLYSACGGYAPPGPKVVVGALGVTRDIAAPPEGDILYIDGSTGDCD